jgi:hypothetical protein
MGALLLGIRRLGAGKPSRHFGAQPFLGL